MRIIMLANYLVLDPAFYGVLLIPWSILKIYHHLAENMLFMYFSTGPTVSNKAVCYPCSQVKGSLSSK